MNNAERVAYMIEKEVFRNNDMSDLTEFYGVTEDDFDEFIERGKHVIAED